MPTASEHQPTTYQPPEALRRAAESAAHSRQETSARGLPPTSPLTGASPGTSSGCGTQATETIRTHPPLRQPRSQGPSGPDAERGPPRLCISSIYYLGCTCVPVPCPLSGAVGVSPLKKTILTLRGGGTCKKTGTLCTKAAALGRSCLSRTGGAPCCVIWLMPPQPLSDARVLYTRTARNMTGGNLCSTYMHWSLHTTQGILPLAARSRGLRHTSHTPCSQRTCAAHAHLV